MSHEPDFPYYSPTIVSVYKCVEPAIFYFDCEKYLTNNH